MVTAELAAAIPALLVVLVLAVSGVMTVRDQVRCLDAARTVARAVARGEDTGTATALGRRLAPTGAAVELHSAGATVEVSVHGRAAPALRWMGGRASPFGRAVAAREDALPEGSR